ncbi:MAG: imelysin family protein [Gammaproteobacteria bacterium]|nr:imelysin family protein [Gammaproteobacteria bacterium]
MKRIIVLATLLFTFCVDAVDKAFFEQVIVHNVERSIVSAKQISTSIKQGKSKKSQALFTQLVRNWKKVETTYMLGDLNEDFLDTPRYIDIFHGNNEDIKAQLDLIIGTNDDLSYALYKHSHKTINALEYLLFTQDLSNARVNAMALIMAKSIEHYLQEIKSAYQTHQAKFVQDEQFASAILLNTLVNSAYALKEWRIGDVAGLSKKYKGHADARRAEYAISQNSTVAILSILQAHKQVIDASSHKDFGDVARKFGAIKEINKTIDLLNQAIAQVEKMQEQDLPNPKGKLLYQSTNQLMQSYYLSLMSKLGFVSKVLDADGD